jgi:hypothetical protein
MPTPALYLKTNANQIHTCNTETSIHRRLRMHLFKMEFTYCYHLISLIDCQVNAKCGAI